MTLYALVVNGNFQARLDELWEEQRQQWEEQQQHREEERIRISDNKYMLCDTLTHLAAVPVLSCDVLVKIGTILVGTEHSSDLGTVMLNRPEQRPLRLTEPQKKAVKNIVNNVYSTHELVEPQTHDLMLDIDQDVNDRMLDYAMFDRYQDY
jgi:hypothetical protein